MNQPRFLAIVLIVLLILSACSGASTAKVVDDSTPKWFSELQKQCHESALFPNQKKWATSILKNGCSSEISEKIVEDIFDWGIALPQVAKVVFQFGVVDGMQANPFFSSAQKNQWTLDQTKLYDDEFNKRDSMIIDLANSLQDSINLKDKVNGTKGYCLNSPVLNNILGESVLCAFQYKFKIKSNYVLGFMKFCELTADGISNLREPECLKALESYYAKRVKEDEEVSVKILEAQKALKKN